MRHTHTARHSVSMRGFVALLSLGLALTLTCGLPGRASAQTILDSVNEPPAVEAGYAQTVAATCNGGQGAGTPVGAWVTLSGSATDPDGDTLSYSWTDGSTVVSVVRSETIWLDLGSHTLILTADDGRGGTTSDTVVVDVVYDWSGVLQPIDPSGSSVFTLGRVVPVRFMLTGASAGITDAPATLSFVKLDDDLTAAGRPLKHRRGGRKGIATMPGDADGVTAWAGDDDPTAAGRPIKRRRGGHKSLASLESGDAGPTAWVGDDGLTAAGRPLKHRRGGRKGTATLADDGAGVAAWAGDDDLSAAARTKRRRHERKTAFATASDDMTAAGRPLKHRRGGRKGIATMPGDADGVTAWAGDDDLTTAGRPLKRRRGGRKGVYTMVEQGDVFRYDAATGQYVCNWNTTGLTPGTYELYIDLGDGAERAVTVDLE